MDRTQATTFTRRMLDQYGLSAWKVRLTTDASVPYLGLCDSRKSTIILNAHHVDMHPDAEVQDTILHEVAHALCPGQGHNEVWAKKAREIGCTNTLPCSHLSLPANVIDAIRSGATIEMEVEEVVHVVRTPKYKVTRLQDKCPECGKVAIERKVIDWPLPDGTIKKIITLECFHIIVKIIPKGTPFEEMVSNDWKDEIKECKHQWPDKDYAIMHHIPSNKCLKCGEFKLYPFQVIGARNAESGLVMQKGFAIFDDMGLGKTVQALALIKYHAEFTPTLFIVKSALKFQFFKNVIRWLGPDYAPQIIRTSKDYVFPNFKTYIISYDLLRRFPRQKLLDLGIKLVILDECQQIKNPDSARTKEVRTIVGSDPTIKVLPLSGTPWKNRGSEFFPVLNMISPTKFHSYQAFLNRWVDFYWDGDKKKVGGIRNIKKFREFTAELLIRREYNEVMDEFPDINRMKLNFQLESMEQETYDDEVQKFADWYNQYVLEGTEDSIGSIELLGKMARMRHLAGLAKVPATLEFVEEFISETDRKLVVFVHHKDVGEALLDEITKMCEGKGIPVMALTAGSDDQKGNIQEEFNNAPRAILIASTLAAGEGLDLQTCADAVMHERQWNPQNEDQAAPGRFRRIGQESNVINITFVEGEDTIDEHIDGIVEDKRQSFHTAMNKSEMQVWNESAFAKELAGRIVAKFNKTKKQKVSA